MRDLSREYEESRRRGYREGLAIAVYEIVEAMIKSFFPENYRMVKYSLRLLSEYEANNLMNDLFKCHKNPDFSVVKKYLYIN